MSKLNLSPGPSVMDTGVSDWIACGRVPSLDGLRALSIGMVITAHLAPTAHSPIPSRHWHIAVLGWLGVPLFFAISGFIITLLLLRERDRTGSISYRDFLVRRALRIVPAYTAFLLALLVFQAAGVLRLPARDWLKAITYTTSLFVPTAWEVGHTWSLSVEEHFYLVWPLLLTVMRKPAWVAAGYILATPLLRLIFLLLRAAGFIPAVFQLDFFTPTRLDGIAWGCCLAYLVRHPRFGRWLTCGTACWWAPFGLTALLILSIGGSWYWQAKSYYYRLFFYHTVNSLCLTGLVGIAVIHHRTLPGRLLNARPIALVGMLSYSLYLWQQPFLKEGNNLWWGRFPANLGMLVACALVSYCLIERPFLQWKDRRNSSHSEKICALLTSSPA